MKKHEWLNIVALSDGRMSSGYHCWAKSELSRVSTVFRVGSEFGDLHWLHHHGVDHGLVILIARCVHDEEPINNSPNTTTAARE